MSESEPIDLDGMRHAAVEDEGWGHHLQAAYLRNGADEIERLRAEITGLRASLVAFAGPWAVRYAKDQGMPDGHLHPIHYDILAKAGARMDDFTRGEAPNDDR